MARFVPRQQGQWFALTAGWCSSSSRGAGDGADAEITSFCIRTRQSNVVGAS